MNRVRGRFLHLQIEYKSRLEGIEIIAADLLKEQLLEGSQPAAKRGTGHRKVE